ncbi:MAG: hypothetical protein AUH21_06060 [Nitrospirae bacterium 13_2_20CM_62_7]|nr:MAG: hypothetical protein AUH21_06060 [Nitrospirae bacterium 13_2_20CM_62_7]
MQAMRILLLVLGLLVSTLVGCASRPVREDDTLAAYRRELARLVETGELTKDDAEKFYGLASLEMERRAKLRAEQRQGRLAIESGDAVNHPSFISARTSGVASSSPGTD